MNTLGSSQFPHQSSPHSSSTPPIQIPYFPLAFSQRKCFSGKKHDHQSGPISDGGNLGEQSRAKEWKIRVAKSIGHEKRPRSVKGWKLDSVFMRRSWAPPRSGTFVIENPLKYLTVWISISELCYIHTRGPVLMKSGALGLLLMSFFERKKISNRDRRWRSFMKLKRLKTATDGLPLSVNYSFKPF